MGAESRDWLSPKLAWGMAQNHMAGSLHVSCLLALSSGPRLMVGVSGVDFALAAREAWSPFTYRWLTKVLLPQGNVPPPLNRHFRLHELMMKIF